MDVQIYRTNASSYQSPAFFQKEKEILEMIDGVHYIKSLNNISKDMPFILLTNTHTNPHELPDVLLDNTILIIHPNSGHDNFPKTFVQNAPFPIVLGNPIRSHAVAEYIMSSLFHHFTPLSNHQHWSDDRTWNRKLLRDQKVLVLGNGNIGKIIHRSLDPLCRAVTVYDPYQSNSFKNPSLITETIKDNSIYDGVQILVLAASLNESSKHMINMDVLKRLHPECIIVNAARGPIINEEELVHFLKKNEKTFAYLDVFEEEPFKPGYLHELKNINKTSHIAGVYKKLNSDIISFESHIIKDFLSHYSEQRENQFKEDYKECLLTSKLHQDQLI